MPEQLKIVIDADVNKAVAGVQNVSKVIAGEFTKATQTASAAAFDLDKSVAAATTRINASIDKMVSDALGDANRLRSVFGNIGDLRVNVQSTSALKTVAGLNAFQAALGKSSAAISQLQSKSAGLNNFFGQIVAGSTKSAAALQRIPTAANASSTAMLNFGRVIQDAPFGILGIANNLNPLIESMQRASVAAKATGTSLAKNLLGSLKGAGGIGLAVSVVSSLLIVFGDRLFSAGKKAEEAKEKIDDFKDTVSGIFGEAAKEAADVAGLIAVLKSETETRERKLATLKELKQIQPEIFGQLKLENDAVANLDVVYKNYLKNLQLVITAKVKQAQLENITKKILEKEGQLLTKSEKDFLDGIKKSTQFLEDKRTAALKTGQAGSLASKLFIDAQKKEGESVDELNTLYKDQAQLIKDLTEFSKGIKIKIPEPDGSDLDKFFDNVIARARQFSKEFGNAFVVPDLEESFFVNKNEIFRRAQKLFNDLATGNLKIKLPVQPEIELLPINEFTIPQSTIDNFFKGVGNEIKIPITVKPDIALEKGNRDLIDQKVKLFEQFKVLGDFGTKEFFKIDFSNINAGIAEATTKLQGMLAIATTLNQAIGQGLSNAFNSVFDAVLEGKSVFKALGNAVKELIVTTIKAVAQMLILKLITNAIFPGAGAAGVRGIPGALGGSANFGALSGIGSRAFSNVLTVNVNGQISGDTILLAGQRAAGSSGRFG